MVSIGRGVCVSCGDVQFGWAIQIKDYRRGGEGAEKGKVKRSNTEFTEKNFEGTEAPRKSWRRDLFFAEGD